MVMRHRSLATAVLVAIIAAMCIGVFFGYRAYSQEASVVTVNGQGIPPALYQQAQTMQAGLQQRYPGYYKTFGDINKLITQILIDQEATRRGIACTQQDGINFIATQVAVAPNAPGGLDDLLRNADLQGVALPSSYLKTPAAQRTPSIADAAATWAADPGVIHGYTDICTTGRLYGAVTPPNATNDQRNTAINTLLATLRKAAHITTSGSVLVNSPTPYSTPLPTATPGVLAMGTQGPDGRIAVGAPSLVSGLVQVPASATGSALAPYTGFTIHLRWNRSLFSFAAASNAGSVLPGSLNCPSPQMDADGAGVIYACTATGGNQTTSAGLLGTISLTPVGTGCSPLHLVTWGGMDNGDSVTGTYTMDTNTTMVIIATADGRTNQLGQAC